MRTGEGRAARTNRRISRADYNFYVDDDRVSIVERRRGSPIDKVVSEMMILVNSEWGRQLAQHEIPALYRAQGNGKVRMSTVPAAHQGLGVAQYIWASSPLRRYADLVNQRQLLALVSERSAALSAAGRAAAGDPARFRTGLRRLCRVPAQHGALLVPALADQQEGVGTGQRRCIARGTGAGWTAFRWSRACPRCRNFGAWEPGSSWPCPDIDLLEAEPALRIQTPHWICEPQQSRRMIRLTSLSIWLAANANCRSHITDAGFARISRSTRSPPEAALPPASLPSAAVHQRHLADNAGRFHCIPRRPAADHIRPAEFDRSKFAPQLDVVLVNSKSRPGR